MANLGDVLANAGKNAGALEHSNQQMGHEASAFDVWTQTYDGMSQRMRDFADDPVGTMERYDRALDKAVTAGLTGEWHSSSFSAVADSIAHQAGGLGEALQEIRNAQGALATVGATFALLTGVEQMLSTLVSVIPFPALPAIRIMDMDVGLPHAHAHPPNLVPPAPPVPLPSTGPIIPIPILSGATRTLINGMPAGRCGDMGLGIWCGGYFPMYEVFLGSSSVWIEGARAGRLAVDITKHCIFTSPKPSDPPMGPMVGVTIMASTNVLIGGVPMPSLLNLAMAAALKAFFKGLGKAARAFERATRGLRQRMFRNMKPGFLRCRILRAEPVNVVTGEVLIEQQDFSLPGRIPLDWNRTYGSQAERIGACGKGWETPADARLVVLESGEVAFFDGSLSPTCFDRLPVEEPVADPIGGDSLSFGGGEYVVRRRNGLAYHFPPLPGQGGETLVNRVTDASWNVVRYHRDPSGLRGIGLDDGRRIDVESRAGLIRSMRLVAADGTTGSLLVRFEYDEHGSLVAVHDGPRPLEFAYGPSGIVRQTNRNGLSFYYEYDDALAGPRCVHTWGDRGLYEYRFRYDDLTHRTEITDSLGQAWVATYNDRYQMTSEIDPLGQVTRYEYDAAGRTVAEIGPDGQATRYEYDGAGNVVVVVRPDGTTSRAEYDAEGLPVSVTSFAGGTWTYRWNERGLLQERITPGGRRWAFVYSKLGDLTETIDPLGRRELCSYDRTGNLTSVRSFAGAVTHYEYDLRGNMIATTDPLGHTLRFIYGSGTRPVRIQLPSGRAIRCDYDAEGQLTRFEDPSGRVTSYSLAGLGEIVKRVNPDGSVREFVYDTEERLVEIIDEDGLRNTLELDPLGRVVREVRFDGSWHRFAYRQSGRIVERTDSAQRLLRYEYDAVGRLISIRDDGAVAERFEYDGEDRLIVAENAERRVELKYDPDGWVVEEIQGSAVTQYEYDGVGNRIGATLPSGRVLRYSYDADGELGAIRMNGRELLRIDRNARGEIEEEHLASGYLRRFQYDVDGLLTGQVLRRGGGTLVERAFMYDASGELLSIFEPGRGADRFSYDLRGRVLDHQRDRGPAGIHHDSLRGSRFRPSQVRERRFQTSTSTYRFDDAGNVVERTGGDGTLLLSYDGLDRLVRVSRNGTVTLYGYDALGRRVRKDSNGSIREYLWDGDVLLQESVSASDSTPREYLHYPDAFEPLAILEGDAIFIVGTDAAGAVRELYDDAGQLSWKAFYDARGGVDTSIVGYADNPVRLSGQYYDAESGLHYTRNRYYDPALGAFITPDPWFSGEDLYEYGPNVWTWTDPLGLVCPRVARRLAARIRRMQRNMTPFERGRTTFAAAEVRLPNGRREVWVAAAGQRGYVPPRIRGRPDRVIVAPARPGHAHLPHINDAERALLRAARREGATIEGIRATRPMCDHCQDALGRGGAAGSRIPN